MIRKSQTSAWKSTPVTAALSGTLLIGVIFALQFVQGGYFLTHERAPLLFASLGLVLGMLPALRSLLVPEDRDAPHGHMRFLRGAAGLLFIAASSAGIAAGFTAFAASGFTGAGMQARLAAAFTWDIWTQALVALHAIPMIFLTWRLPLGSALFTIPIGIGMLLGTLKITLLASAHPAAYFQGDTGRAWLILGLVLAPWLSTWAAQTFLRGHLPLKKSFGCLLLFAIGLSPAWTMGIVSLSNGSSRAGQVDPLSKDFKILGAYLSPNGNSIYANVNTGALSEGSGQTYSDEDQVIHIRMDHGDFQVLGSGFIRHQVTWDQGSKDPRHFPHVKQASAHIWSPRHAWDEQQPSPKQVLDLNLGLQDAFEDLGFAKGYFPEVWDLGLGEDWNAWKILPWYAGSGLLLHRKVKGLIHEAVYDPFLKQVFYGDSLRFPLFQGAEPARIMEPLWVLPPRLDSPRWRTFDPRTGDTRKAKGIKPLDWPGPALDGGRMLTHRRGLLSIYDPVRGTQTPITSNGSDVEVPGNAQLTSAFHIPCADWIAACLVQFEVPTGDPNNTFQVPFLGMVDLESATVHWIDWDASYSIVGSSRLHELYYVKDQKQIHRVDLKLGESSQVFPAQPAL